ncbi:MAG: glycerol-3-phosphate dehydrogenase/oxidase [Bacteroidota bacterium]
MVVRGELLAKLKSESAWDVVIIGGGASGLGAAIESVTRGYSTLLLEQHDFTKGTSSRSTKLIHGGVRYLAQGNISLVLEALRERGLLLKNAPHLVSDLSFIIPSYSWWAIPFYTIGLTVYDLLAGRLSFGRSKPQTKKKTIKRLPTVKKDGLRGGILYHDGQFDDSRLGINMAQTIIDNGGVAINYMCVTGFNKTGNKIDRVVAIDNETGIEYSIKTKSVINATGVFVDDIIKKDDINAKDIVRPSQGVHIVLDKEFLPSKYGLMIPKTPDGRVLFALPFYDKVIVGTTDVPKDELLLEPIATEEEVDFILETSGRYLSKKPKRSDVKSVFAGLRPLAAPDKEGGKTREISRGHKIYQSESGLVSIIGGKWTTYRQMGEDLIDKVIETAELTPKESVTKHYQLHGYRANIDKNSLHSFYGSDLNLLDELILQSPNLNNWISESLKINEAQVVLACRNEFARTVEDFLSRRTRAIFMDAAESVRMAPAVARLMAEEMGYDKEWEENQVKAFTEVAESYLLTDINKLSDKKNGVPIKNKETENSLTSL